MTDLPPELVEKLARVIDSPRPLSAAQNVLTALLAHAGPDATHLDLSTWEGVRATYETDRLLDGTVIPLFTIEPTEAP